MTRLAVEMGGVLAVLDLVACEVLVWEVDLVLPRSQGGGGDEGEGCEEDELHCVGCCWCGAKVVNYSGDEDLSMGCRAVELILEMKTTRRGVYIPFTTPLDSLNSPENGVAVPLL